VLEVVGSDMTDPALSDIYAEWERWAASVPESEMDTGWQVGFPRWPELLEVAEKTMMRPLRDKETVNLLEKCWEINECCEDLADFAREHISDCLDLVAELATSNLRDVRWQAYYALSNAGAAGEAILRRSLNDTDSYCRRRAYLALAEMHPPDAFQLAGEIISDEDPYMRIAAVELLRTCGDATSIAEAKAQLLVDPNQFVRRAAEERLA
jgi:hypothetical protein